MFKNKSPVEARAVLALDTGKRHGEGLRQEKVLCTPRHGRNTEQQQITRYRLVFMALVAKVGHQPRELPFCSPSLVAQLYTCSAGLAAKLALKPYTCIYSCRTLYALLGWDPFSHFSLQGPNYVDAQGK